MRSDLAASLDAILAHGKNVVPEAVKSLRPPARHELKRLGRALGRALPADLATWFSKHNGQDFLAEGLDPTAPAMSWLSVADAISERRALIDHPEKMLPWDDRWLPIVTNGGGDFYVYVTGGPEAGAIKFYLHDARRRPRIARSLADFAANVARALAARDTPRPSFKFGELVGKLEDCDAPSLETLRRAPAGTVFYRRALPYRSCLYWLFVKVTKTAWAAESAKCKGVRDLRIDTALAKVRKRVREQPVADWQKSPKEVRDALTNAKAFPQGVFALEGRDPRSDPYFARKKGQLAPARERGTS